MATGSGKVHFQDGSLDFSGGVDSVKVTTVASEQNPGGLGRNQLAWLINGSVRDSGITQRTGWMRLSTVHSGSGIYQGGAMYNPDSEDPYLMFMMGGEVFMVRPDFPEAVVNLTSAFSGTKNPSSPPLGHFTQAEKFMIIQPGDGVTLPLFWDGTTLRRSLGITNNAVPPGTPGVNEIPAATAMDYYQGRLWYARGRRYAAGDIVGGDSGTVGNQQRDAILNVTESPLVLGGDGFTVPTQAGTIRALFHNANINATLGEGQLFVGTRKAIYAQQVPVSRNDWISATANNPPVQTVVQLNNGPVGDRCITKANGDIFYQTLEPSIASLFASVRNFGQWGNRSISNNEQRLWVFNDRALMTYSSGVQFNNRMLQCALPYTVSQGVVHRAIVPLDFIPISSFLAQAAPVWEGMYEALPILQLFVGDYGGRERCFALVVSDQDSTIELWELTDYQREDFNAYGEKRVTWIIEFPAFTWGRELELKKLVSAELWVDKLRGKVNFKLEWRPDGDPCWKLWKNWEECTAKNSCEDVINPICYPIDNYRESYKATMTLPEPPTECDSTNGRPANIAYQIQTRLTITGWCRIRAMILHAEQYDRQLYQNMVC